MAPQLALLLWLAQSPPAVKLDAETLRLARIKYHMSEILTKLPNYTCMQTIERSRRRARSRRFELDDTLRMEVALVSGRELFSWPGEGKFEERELRDMVSGGTFGNGNFGLHARSVFLSNAPTYGYEGAMQRDGRGLFRYSYSVPQNLSGYRIRVGEQEAIVAYRGHFLVEETNLDLVELVVITDEIPPFLAIASSSTTVLYERMKIGEGQFLLPKSSVLTMTDLMGGESRNTTQFAQCRQYGTESFISFADPPSPEKMAEAPAVPRELNLPAGMTLDLRLETPVGGKTAIGDELLATLGADAKIKGKTIVPKGAQARGRVLNLMRPPGRQETLIVELQFLELTFPGARVRLQVELESVNPSIFPGTRIEQTPARTDAPLAGRISLRGNRLQLGKGFRMVWRTLERGQE
jgi:hypothetical protein